MVFTFFFISQVFDQYNLSCSKLKSFVFGRFFANFLALENRSKKVSMNMHDPQWKKYFPGRNNKSRSSAFRNFLFYQNIICFDWVKSFSILSEFFFQKSFISTFYSFKKKWNFQGCSRKTHDVEFPRVSFL